MPAFPADPFDRLAELEATVQELSRRLAAGRVPPLAATPRTVWAARTAEPEDEESLAYPHYPPSGIEPGKPFRLPIILQDVTVNDSDELVRTDRSEWPNAVAISPIGWLPPTTEIEVAWDGRQYRIIRWPINLMVKTIQQIPAAQWGQNCDAYILGNSLNCQVLKIWAPSEQGIALQKYADESTPVLMRVWNLSNEIIPAKKAILISPLHLHVWVATVEPCGGVCAS
jgi:hypothetical protein